MILLFTIESLFEKREGEKSSIFKQALLVIERCAYKIQSGGYSWLLSCICSYICLVHQHHACALAIWTNNRAGNMHHYAFDLAARLDDNPPYELTIDQIAIADLLLKVGSNNSTTTERGVASLHIIVRPNRACVRTCSIPFPQKIQIGSQEQFRRKSWPHLRWIEQTQKFQLTSTLIVYSFKQGMKFDQEQPLI